jgi:hypothetical protein
MMLKPLPFFFLCSSLIIFDECFCVCERERNTFFGDFLK